MRNVAGYVKLAQLHNLAGTPNEKKYELADQLDINYSVPDDLKAMKTMRKILSGYTPLHVSVMRSDVDLALALLRRGADIFKQTALDEWTPLHLVLHNTKIVQQMIWDVSGYLEQHQLIDILLTAHVQTGNDFNPTSKQGLSHLHIACMYNHEEAVQFLANSNVVGQAVNLDSHWPGYTALHFAVRYSAFRAVEVLLANNADIHAKDAAGISPLQLMIERMVDLMDSLAFGKPPDPSIVVKEFIWLQESKLKLEVARVKDIILFVLGTQRAKNVDFSKPEGLVVLHAACALEDTSVLQDLLATSINLDSPVASDSPLWPGWTPLHFAACCSLEAVKLLVDRGENLNAKNTKGETALDFCLRKYSPSVIHDILSMDETLKNILLTDGTTKLSDVILLMSDCDKFNDFLQTNANVRVSLDSPLWSGYSLLHLAVRMNEVPSRIVCQDMNDSVFGICYCFEDFHSTKQNEATTFWEILSACLSMRCSLITAKDANGSTPIHLAFQLQKSIVVAELMKFCQEDAVDCNGLSHLHIACALDCPQALAAIKKFLRRGSNVATSPVRKEFEWHNELLSKTAKPRLIKVQADSTALHIAVAFKNERVVEYLLARGADVYARDALGRTPMHLSLSASSKIIGRLLLSHAPNLTDSVCDQNEQSYYLHVAAFANDDLTIRKLLRHGADRTAVLEGSDSDFAGNTPLHVAVKVDSDKAVRELLRTGPSAVDEENPLDRYDTPLERAVRMTSNATSSLASFQYFVMELKNCGYLRVFPSGINALHFACSQFDRKWARQLLEANADPNARVCDDDDYTGPWKGYTALHLLIRQARENNQGLKYLLGMVQLLLKHGADPTLENRDGRSPMMMAVDALLKLTEITVGDSSADAVHWRSTVNVLFDSVKRYNRNPVGNDGLSLFHFACTEIRTKVVRRFLANGVDVNLTMDPFGRYNGYTPLHTALNACAGEAACLLIQRGADVKAEDVDGKTPLHLAVTLPLVWSFRLVGMLLRNGADVNAKDLNDRTPMHCLLRSQHLTIQLVEFLRKSGGTVDAPAFLSVEGSIGLAMKNAFAKDALGPIFESLLEICNLRNAIVSGFQAIHNVVSVTTNGVIPTHTYVSYIEQLMVMGCELDQQDEEGVTALHKAVQFHNVEAIRALLLLGADINIADEHNVSPFMAAFLDYPATSGIDDNAHLKNLAIKLLTRHAYKLNFLGLHMHSDIRKTVNHVVNEKSRWAFDHKFQEELARLNSLQICESTFLGDFMSESKAVAAYPRMLAWKRQIVDYYFDRGAAKAFPQTAEILALQFRKARARKGLVEQAKIFMEPLWPCPLPDLCSEAVLEFLCNDELKLLVNGDSESLCSPYKRRRLQ